MMFRGHVRSILPCEKLFFPQEEKNEHSYIMKDQFSSIQNHSGIMKEQSGSRQEHSYIVE